MRRPSLFTLQSEAISACSHPSGSFCLPLSFSFYCGRAWILNCTLAQGLGVGAVPHVCEHDSQPGCLTAASPGENILPVLHSFLRACVPRACTWRLASKLTPAVRLMRCRTRQGCRGDSDITEKCPVFGARSAICKRASLNERLEVDRACGGLRARVMA